MDEWQREASCEDLRNEKVLRHCLVHFLGDTAAEAGRAIDALNVAGQDRSCSTALVEALLAGAAAAAPDDNLGVPPCLGLPQSSKPLCARPKVIVTPRVATARSVAVPAAARRGGRQRSLPPDLELLQCGSRSSLIARLVAGSLPRVSSSLHEEAPGTSGELSCASAASCICNVLLHLMPPAPAAATASLLKEELARRSGAKGEKVMLADVEELLTSVLAITLPQRSQPAEVQLVGRPCEECLGWPSEPRSSLQPPWAHNSPRTQRRQRRSLDKFQSNDSEKLSSLMLTTSSADAGAGSARVEGPDAASPMKDVAGGSNIADGDGAAGLAIPCMTGEQQPTLYGCCRRAVAGSITVCVRLLDGTTAAELLDLCAHETVHEVKIRLFARDPMLTPHRQKLVHGIRVVGDDELLSTLVDPGSGEVALGLVRVMRTLVLSTSKDGKLLLWDLPDGMLAGAQSVPSAAAMAADGGAGVPSIGCNFKKDAAVDVEESECCSSVLSTLPSSKDSTSPPMPLACASIGCAPEHVGAVSVDWTRPRALVAVNTVLKLWDLSAAASGLGSGSNEMVLHGHTGIVFAVDVQWREGRALSGSQDKTVRLWDIRSGQCLRVFEGHQHTVRCISGGWSVGQAISGSTDHDLLLWNLDTGQCSWQLKEAHRAIVTVVLADWESGRVLTGGENSLRLWSLQPQEQSDLKGVPEPSLSDHSASCGSRPTNGPLITAARCFLNSATGVPCALKAGSSRGALKSASFADEAVTNKHLLRVFVGHQRGVTAACVHWSSNRLLSAARDDSMRLWDIEAGECLRCFHGSEYGILSLAVDWAQGRAVSGSGDRNVRLWDLESGEVQQVLNGHTGVVCGVALS